MIRTVRTVALLTALTFTAIAGPVSASTGTSTSARGHVRHQQTVPAPIDPSTVDQLLGDLPGPVAAALEAVVNGVVGGVDDLLNGILSGVSDINPAG